MYTLTTTQITDFLTADFMPVTTNSTVSGAAIDGAVTQYKVMRGGAGYTTGIHIIIKHYEAMVLVLHLM